MKHNKKRNTAFIYETLSRELTKAILDKDVDRKDKVLSIIREHFSSKNSVLGEELRLYKMILETKNINKELAERIIREAKTSHSALNEKEIFNAQSQLISSINKGLGQHVWSTFVPNFKFLASVDAIFSNKTALKRRVLFEQAAVDAMSKNTNATQSEELKSVDSLTYRTFIDKFNNKYEGLLHEQKDLLNNYIAGFADRGFEMRLYLDNELGRLKASLKESTQLAENDLTKQKMAEVAEYLEGFRKREFTDEDLIKVLKTQELVRELAAND